MYGDIDSPLHRAVGTDRFIAHWLMSVQRVVAPLGCQEPGPSHEGVQIMDRSMDVAVQWRGATRAVFTYYPTEGYEVPEPLCAGTTSDYLLVRGG